MYKKQLNSLKQQLQYQKISCQNENNRIKSKNKIIPKHVFVK